MDIVLLIGGLLLILVGANALTDGAASVAKRFNISSLVIGLTIVAFGTSAPELTVSVVSALKGSSDIAIGNVVGSNIFNALMIVGCTAAIVPISVTKGTVLFWFYQQNNHTFGAKASNASFIANSSSLICFRRFTISSCRIVVSLLSFSFCRAPAKVIPLSLTRW